MAMTVSLSKGKMAESNFAHNERKSRLEGKSQEVVESFYATEHHQHINCFFTRLNVDKPHEDFGEVYDRLFGKAIEEYNSKQKRKDRMIGKGKAIDGELKKNNILELKIMLEYLKKSDAEREKFVQSLGGQQLFADTFLKKYQSKTETDLKKGLAFWKSQETYGEAYYKKIKSDNKTKTHVEFVAQLGNAEDFNEVKNGKIVKSYDREDPAGKWQQAKKVLKEYMDSFQERNPNLILVGYSIHMDESTPHVHFDIVPVADQNKTTSRGKKKNGLSKKLSFNGALESQGFKGSPKKYFTEWQHQETEVLADLMQKELGEKRKSGKTNKIENVYEYKKLKALEAEKLEKNASLDQQINQKQTVVNDLENQQQDLTQKISKSIETVKEFNDWTEKKKHSLDDREKDISSREEKLVAGENDLKKSQNVLESRTRAFNEKVKKSGNLDEQIAKKQKKVDEMDEVLNNYSSNLDKKKKQILAKKQKELDKKKAEQLAEYKKQVDRQKQVYIDDVNRHYRQTLKQREEDLEQREDDQDQREKRFADKIKNLVKNVRIAYISHGLRTMYGTKREVQYQAQKYLQMSRDQQKAVEKQAFSGPGGLYSKLLAFKDAVDYLFHGNENESSPLEDLQSLAREAESNAEYYNNLENNRTGLRNSGPSRSRSVGPEL